MKLHCSTLKGKIIAILKKKKRFQDFFRSQHFCIVVKNEPYMPLVIEKNTRVVKVARLNEISGRQLYPVFEFWIGKDKRWYPASIRYEDNSFIQSRYWRNGQEYIVPVETENQIKTARSFASELCSQGF